MKLLLVGGFLGAGKTTLISRLISSMKSDHMKIAVIENEFGKTAIDNILLQRNSVKIATISGGCVCCQLAAGLITALAEIEEDIAPDWCIAELSGMANTADTLAVLHKYYRSGLLVYTMVLADAQRWPVLNRIAGPRLNAQIAGADILVLTKTDLAAEMPYINTNIPVYMSTENLWPLIKNASAPLNAAQSATSPAQKNPGIAYHLELQYDGLFTLSQIKQQMKSILEDEARKNTACGVIPGHIKALAVFDDGYIAASMTTPDTITYTASANEKKREITKNYSLTVNVLIV